MPIFPQQHDSHFEKIPDASFDNYFLDFEKHLYKNSPDKKIGQITSFRQLANIFFTKMALKQPKHYK